MYELVWLFVRQKPRILWSAQCRCGNAFHRCADPSPSKYAVSKRVDRHRNSSRLLDPKTVEKVTDFSIRTPAERERSMEHRRFLAHPEAHRPFIGGDVLRRIGGRAAVEVLVDGLYDRIE